MLSEYQKQLNRIYFFSNKVVSIGKIDYKPQFKPINTLISRLKQQMEQNITIGIEKELTLEQIEKRVKIFLPNILNKVELDTTSFKDYFEILQREKILSKLDITTYRKEIKDIITQEIEKFREERDKKELERQLLEQRLDRQKELEKELEQKVKKVKEESSTDSQDDKKVKKLIEARLEANKEDEDIGDLLREKDLNEIFSELEYKSSPAQVADYIFDLYQEGKIDKNSVNITIQSAEVISKILEKEKGVAISKYLIQAIMGRKSKTFDLKNILSKLK